MAKAAQPKHRDDVAGARSGVAQGVEGCDSRTQERRGVNGRQVIRKPRHGADRRDHAFAVATVEADAGDLLSHAREQISAPARVAPSAISAVPPDTNALTRRPLD